jgi:hypothetical protein
MTAALTPAARGRARGVEATGFVAVAVFSATSTAVLAGAFFTGGFCAAVIGLAGGFFAAALVLAAAVLVAAFLGLALRVVSAMMFPLW